MFRIQKRLEIAGAHCLTLPYESKCNCVHGHNWQIAVDVEAEELDACGMVLDFSRIAAVVREFDHMDLNALMPPGWNPTAEHIAQIIAVKLKDRLTVDDIARKVQVLSVQVRESEGNRACYMP